MISLSRRTFSWYFHLKSVCYPPIINFRVRIRIDLRVCLGFFIVRVKIRFKVNDMVRVAKVIRVMVFFYQCNRG